MREGKMVPGRGRGVAQGRLKRGWAGRHQGCRGAAAGGGPVEPVEHLVPEPNHIEVHSVAAVIWPVKWFRRERIAVNLLHTISLGVANFQAKHQTVV